MYGGNEDRTSHEHAGEPSAPPPPPVCPGLTENACVVLVLPASTLTVPVVAPITRPVITFPAKDADVADTVITLVVAVDMMDRGPALVSTSPAVTDRPPAATVSPPVLTVTPPLTMDSPPLAVTVPEPLTWQRRT